MKEFVPFIDSRLHIQWDEKFGFGVYAKENIPNGIYVEMAPAIVFERSAHSITAPFLKYALAWHNETLALPLGWIGIYNHSDENNCHFSTNIVDELIGILTVKDILKEEQLTVNYGPDWFSSRQIEKLKL